jgi:DegV family protein with EDD domain
MSKTAIIATSTSCLDYLNLKEDNLFVLRMKILMGDKTFEDYIGITAEDFYSTIKADKKLVPSSTMPSIGEFLELLEHLEEQGYEEVLTITISSELSGTYGVIKAAVDNNYDGDLRVHVLDSRNAAISEGFLSLEALRLFKEGQSMEEVIKYLEALRTNRKQYFMVDNLRLFVANGRLSNAAGFMAGALKLKPILEVNDEGKIVPFEKIRTSKKALDKMVNYVIEDCKKLQDFIITYDTSDNIEGLEYVKSKMEEAFPGYTYYEAPITPVIGCHTGEGTVGIAYFDTSKK